MPCEARTRGSGEVLCVTRTFFTRGSGEVLCVTRTFFSPLLNRTREARALCAFQHHKGENLFFFLFSYPVIVGLRGVVLIIANMPRNVTSYLVCMGYGL